MGLHVQASEDVEVAPGGGELSVGRDADISLLGDNGRPDEALHAEAFFIGNLGDRWTIRVPADARYEVQVRTRDDTHVVQVGEEAAFRAGEAELVVETEMGISRARVVAAPAQQPRERRKKGTVVPSLDLDPTSPNHRVWIVACRDRLDRQGAGALSYAEIAKLLSASGHWEDVDLTAAAVRVRAHRARQGEVGGWLEVCGDVDSSRDEIVDALVRRGVVTKHLLRQATDTT